MAASDEKKLLQTKAAPHEMTGLQSTPQVAVLQRTDQVFCLLLAKRNSVHKGCR